MAEWKKKKPGHILAQKIYSSVFNILKWYEMFDYSHGSQADSCSHSYTESTAFMKLGVVYFWYQVSQDKHLQSLSATWHTSIPDLPTTSPCTGLCLVENNESILLKSESHFKSQTANFV